MHENLKRLTQHDTTAHTMPSWRALLLLEKATKKLEHINMFLKNHLSWLPTYYLVDCTIKDPQTETHKSFYRAGPDSQRPVTAST